MIAWLLLLLRSMVGVRVVRASVGLDRWPKEAEHCAGRRYLRLYLSLLVFGRFMDFEVRL